MQATTQDIKQIYRQVQQGTLPSHTLSKKKLSVRPHSISVEDAFFGDSGKGAVIAKLNRIFSKKKKLYSLRYNGGGNAGHESKIDGKVIVTHHLPMAVVERGATAIMGRGMLIHPEDAVLELETVTKQFGGKLPGKLLIDERAVLSLDTHRALETVLNAFTIGGRGSTGRGIATAYASFYQRIALTVKDFMSSSWEEVFSAHYALYEKMIAGFGREYSLKDVTVTSLEKGKRTVGTQKEFLSRLKTARAQLAGYISPKIYSLLRDAWHDTKVAFTFEGAQGSGLDPYHGVYPDVTSSRCLSRAINDSTYNVILPEEISLRLAVMKTTYVSSVGIRKLPTKLNGHRAAWIQKAFDERGRSTGRLRDIYEVSIPIAQYLRQAAGYDALVATHLDASLIDEEIPVITSYTNGTRREMPYLPFQDSLDYLTPHTVTFPGWDGEKVKTAKKPSDLPIECRRYLAFLGKTIAPVVIGTYGPDLSEYVSWIRIES